MATIVIATQAGVSDAQLVKDLRGLVDGGVARIAAALLGGEALFEGDLFDSPRDEVFARVRRLLSVLEDHRLDPLVWEAGHRISAQTLRNIMEAADDSARAFDRLTELGHKA